MMFRHCLWGNKLPDWFYDPPQGDWPLHMMNVEHGDFGYIDQIFSAYRIHGAGIWNKETEAEKVTGNLECQRHFLKNLRPENVKAARPVITKHLYGDVKRLLRQGHVETAQIVMDWIEEHGLKVPKVLELKTKLRLGLAKMKSHSIAWP